MSEKDLQGMMKRLREQTEAVRKTQDELKAHPEALDAVQLEITSVDNQINELTAKFNKAKEDFDKKIVDLKDKRTKVQELKNLMTGVMPSKREGTTGERGAKAKFAWDFLVRKGIGSTFTGKELDDAVGYLGGAGGAFIKSAKELGFLDQPQPRGPYRILKLPQ